MFKRFLAVAFLFGSLALLAATAAIPSGGAPSGQRMFGNTSFDSSTGFFTGGGGTIEPAYDDTTGTLVYLSTPNNAHVNLNAPLDTSTGMPRNVAPIYLPVYPVASGIDPASLNCAHIPVDNCPDHGPIVAGAVSALPAYASGVAGHDHLVGIASTGGDFNILWEPVLVIFTTKGCTVADPACNSHTRILTLDQINTAVANQTAFLVPLPQLTFHCSSVSAAAYSRATPST
jgi:hypothetical protein